MFIKEAALITVFSLRRDYWSDQLDKLASGKVMGPYERAQKNQRFKESLKVQQQIIIKKPKKNYDDLRRIRLIKSILTNKGGQSWLKNPR
jgi:hypothetical protein